MNVLNATELETVKMIHFMSCIFYYKKKKTKLEGLPLSSGTASGQAFLIQVPEEPPRGRCGLRARWAGLAAQLCL